MKRRNFPASMLSAILINSSSKKSFTNMGTRMPFKVN